MEREKLTTLVTEAQAGNSSAMEELFSAFYNDVYYFALKTVKDADIACDITQETFLEIIRTVNQLKEPAAFVTWMKQVTYHQCTRYFKKKKDVLVDEDEDGNTIFDTLADESGDSIPSEVYEKAEFRETIMGIIGELTEEQRSAVMMYYFDELSVGQIAEIQSVSEGTVKSRLNYARKAIKKSVESYEEKHNVKLHSVALLPLLRLFFGEETMSAVRVASVRAAVAESAAALGTAGTAAAGASAVSAGAAAATSAAGVSASAATAGASAAASAAALTKITAMPLLVKIVGGVLAAVVAVSAGVAVSSQLGDKDGNDTTAVAADTEPAPEETSDKRYDGHIHEDGTKDFLCDYCGIALCIADPDMGDHWDMNRDCKCDYCSAQFHTKDIDGADGLCDGCGTPVCLLFADAPHTDLNRDCACDHCGIVNHTSNADDTDGLCDGCGTPVCLLYEDGSHADLNRDCACDGCGTVNHTMDTDGTDGLCDGCGTPVCLLDEPGSHTDLNSDCACDHCGAASHSFFMQRDCGYCSVCYEDIHEDADGDVKCDSCAEYLCSFFLVEHKPNYDDGIYDEICDVCGGKVYGGMGWGGDDLDHADNDGDFICDACGDYVCDDFALEEFGGVDENGDFICDICGNYICDFHNILTDNYHTDLDKDGYCDTCPHSICAHEFVPHTDANGDQLCDRCFQYIYNS